MSKSSQEWLELIKTRPAPATGEPIRIMNVCGGHERSITNTGLRSLLPKHIALVPGYGCPVYVKQAAKKRLVQPGLNFHSNRGAEYVANMNRNWLKDNGVIQSMNRKGVMNDNAEMESFFHQFKAECIHRNKYVTEKELRAVIIEYVGFYNRKRTHSSLDYMTPFGYEVRMG